MDKTFIFLRQWIEVWPLLIPLSFFLFSKEIRKKNSVFLLYTIVSLILAFLANITWLYGKKIPGWLVYNGIFYNISSILRVFLWGGYLYSLKQVKRQKYVLFIIAGYVLFVPFNFLFLEPFFYLGPHLYAAESIILLVFSLTYYLTAILDDDDISFKDHTFLICTGISLFEAINFFIFLFLFELSDENHSLAKLSFRISQFSFLIFCIILTVGLYKSVQRNKLSYSTAT